MPTAPVTTREREEKTEVNHLRRSPSEFKIYGIIMLLLFGTDEPCSLVQGWLWRDRYLWWSRCFLSRRLEESEKGKCRAFWTRLVADPYCSGVWTWRRRHSMHRVGLRFRKKSPCPKITIESSYFVPFSNQVLTTHFVLYWLETKIQMWLNWLMNQREQSHSLFSVYALMCITISHL